MAGLLIAHVLFYIVLVSDQVGHTERASARKGGKGREDSGLYSKKWVKKMRTKQGVDSSNGRERKNSLATVRHTKVVRFRPILLRRMKMLPL
jgi:hypothetical protein